MRESVTEGGVSELVIQITGGTHTFNIYEQDPELDEALGRIERLLQEILEKLQGDGTYAPSKGKPLVGYTQGHRGVWMEVETVVRLYFSMSAENFSKLEKPPERAVTGGLKKGGDDATLKTSYLCLSYLK